MYRIFERVLFKSFRIEWSCMCDFNHPATWYTTKYKKEVRWFHLIFVWYLSSYPNSSISDQSNLLCTIKSDIFFGVILNWWGIFSVFYVIHDKSVKSPHLPKVHFGDHLIKQRFVQKIDGLDFFRYVLCFCFLCIWYAAAAAYRK